MTFRQTRTILFFSFAIACGHSKLLAQNATLYAVSESTTEEQEEAELKQALCDGDYYLLPYRDRREYPYPFKGDRYQFKRNGKVKATIKGKSKEGYWQYKTWYHENECDLRIVVDGDTFCYTIDSMSGWRKKDNKRVPFCFYVTSQGQTKVFASTFRRRYLQQRKVML